MDLIKQLSKEQIASARKAIHICLEIEDLHSYMRMAGYLTFVTNHLGNDTKLPMVFVERIPVIKNDILRYDVIVRIINNEDQTLTLSAKDFLFQVMSA
jgi:hypothetical protein